MFMFMCIQKNCTQLFPNHDILVVFKNIENSTCQFVNNRIMTIHSKGIHSEHIKVADD